MTKISMVVFYGLLMLLPITSKGAEGTKSGKALMPSEKALQILQASSGTWKTFAAQRSDMETKFNEGSQLVVLEFRV
jgi:hypothetical protein